MASGEVADIDMAVQILSGEVSGSAFKLIASEGDYIIVNKKSKDELLGKKKTFYWDPSKEENEDKKWYRAFVLISKDVFEMLDASTTPASFAKTSLDNVSFYETNMPFKKVSENRISAPTKIPPSPGYSSFMVRPFAHWGAVNPTADIKVYENDMNTKWNTFTEAEKQVYEEDAKASGINAGDEKKRFEDFTDSQQSIGNSSKGPKRSAPTNLVFDDPKSAKSAKSDKVGNSEEAEESGNVGNSGDVGNSGKAGKAGNSGKAGKTGKARDVGNSEEADKVGKSGKSPKSAKAPQQSDEGSITGKNPVVFREFLSNPAPLEQILFDKYRKKVAMKNETAEMLLTDTEGIDDKKDGIPFNEPFCQGSAIIIRDIFQTDILDISKFSNFGLYGVEVSVSDSILKTFGSQNPNFKYPVVFEDAFMTDPDEINFTVIYWNKKKGQTRHASVRKGEISNEFSVIPFNGFSGKKMSSLQDYGHQLYCFFQCRGFFVKHWTNKQYPPYQESAFSDETGESGQEWSVKSIRDIIFHDYKGLTPTIMALVDWSVPENKREWCEKLGEHSVLSWIPIYSFNSWFIILQYFKYRAPHIKSSDGSTIFPKNFTNLYIPMATDKETYKKDNNIKKFIVEQ